MTQVPAVADYATKDYAGFRAGMLANARTAGAVGYFPEWTAASDENPNDLGVAMIEAFAWVGDILSYYGDRIAQESFLQTATLRSSIVNLAAMLDYRPTAAVPSSVTLTFIIPSNTAPTPVTIPAGTKVSSPDGDPAVCPAVTFETTVDVIAVPDPVNPVTVNVTALQGQTVPSETLGNSTGQANQGFPLSRLQVIEGSVRVVVDEGVGALPWTFTSHLVDASGNDPSFTIANDNLGRSFVVFGDGINGRVPASGAVIQATYRVGGGAVGNLGSATIDTIINPTGLPMGVTVTNLRPSTGGLDAESNDSIRINAPKSLRTLHRAVSLQDYADLATLVPGVGKANATATTASNITLFIAPTGGGQPSSPLLDAVAAYLGPDKVMVGTNVTLYGPTYVPVTIVVDVVVDSRYPQNTVRSAAYDAIATLLATDSTTFGQRLVGSDVYQAVQSVPGVRSLSLTTQTRIGGPTASAPLEVVCAPYEIPILIPGGATINISGGIDPHGVPAAPFFGGGGAGNAPNTPGIATLSAQSCNVVGGSRDGSYTAHFEWSPVFGASFYSLQWAEYDNSGNFIGIASGTSQSTQTYATITTLGGAPARTGVTKVFVRAYFAINGGSGTRYSDGPVLDVPYNCT